MANIPLKSIKFPDLDDTYTVPSNAGELPYNKSATYPADTVGKALQDKPDADGTIANAEQLHSTVGVTDTEPFSFRTSGGSLNIGDREELTLVGVDVGWNQLVKNGNFADGTTNWSASSATLTAQDGTASFSATAQYGSIRQVIAGLKQDHKYLFSTQIKSVGGTSNIKIYASSRLAGLTKNVGESWTEFAFVNSCTADSSPTLDIQNNDASSWKTINVRNAILVDLTVLLGSTIADYIYTLEQSTAGSGVAFFTKYFGTGYKAYDSGSLQSPVVKGIKMTGFNQWDEEWETGGISNASGQLANDPAHFRSKNYIRVLPNTSYCFTHLGNALTNFLYFYWYDADKNFISYGNVSGVASVHTSPSNACYMRFRNGGNGDNPTYNHDICINLHWDGERDGEYEAYKEYTYDIDQEPLHGIMTIEDGKLKADGDIRHADGTIDRWFTYRNYQSGDESLANAITDGVHTSVKKQTPTTETAEPFTTPMVVDDWGTEEFRYNDGTTKFVPVGHSTKYLPNLKAKLEMSPDSPNGDGVYVVEQSGGINTYIPLASADTITSIISRLEALENA